MSHEATNSAGGAVNPTLYTIPSFLNKYVTVITVMTALEILLEILEIYKAENNVTLQRLLTEQPLRSKFFIGKAVVVTSR